ncbi:MAG: nuclear transport factor 2 family protein [Bacteroidia bacterium]|nr:nuclear transport factor 2 family protein [Bacteroidia bacterium]
MKFRIKSTYIFMFLSISLYAQEYSGSGEDINIILTNIKNFSRAYVGADYDKLTDFYSKDGKIFPTGADIIEGHLAIKKRWTLAKDTKILSHKITPIEISVVDNIAYDYGYYQGTSSKNEVIDSWKGKYVIIWKKVEGDWKIYLDIWNRVDPNK